VLLASADVGIVSCNRVADCGAIFHQMCLEIQNYDIHARDGCLKCNAKSLIESQHAKSLRKNELDSSKTRSIEFLDEADDNDVIILD
jgi:hypothetical protein